MRIISSCMINMERRKQDACNRTNYVLLYQMMNLLEHYIKEIHSVRDITEEFTGHCARKPKEPLLEVDLTYDCYGIVTREKKTFWKSDFENAKKEGYFTA